MKTILKASILSFAAFILAFGAGAQTKPPLKEVICKEWKVKNFELFGVSHEPDSAQLLNGKLLFTNDGTCKITNMSRTYTGKWTVDAKNTFLTITEDGNNDKKMYKVYNYSDTELLIEYKDPELMKTKFLLVPAK
jgi:hypothetical protein